MSVQHSICESLSDQEIIRRSLADMAFFACLYNRYASRLTRYIRAVGRLDPEEAADVLQEAFIKIWKNLNGFDTSLKASSWIYRIVHNETISFLRGRKTLIKRRESLDPADLYPIGESGLNEAEMALRDQRLHTALQQLPDEYREVLILRFFEGMRYEDISDVLKIPDGTVATRISRAKKQLAASTHLPDFFNEIT